MISGSFERLNQKTQCMRLTHSQRLFRAAFWKMKQQRPWNGTGNGGLHNHFRSPHLRLLNKPASNLSTIDRQSWIQPNFNGMPAVGCWKNPHFQGWSMAIKNFGFCSRSKTNDCVYNYYVNQTSCNVRQCRHLSSSKKSNIHAQVYHTPPRDKHNLVRRWDPHEQQMKIVWLLWNRNKKKANCKNNCDTDGDLRHLR